MPSVLPQCVVIMSLAFSSLANCAFGASYSAPFGGYDYVYDAANGVLPNEPSGVPSQPIWTNGGYDSSSAQVINGDPLAGQAILRLDHTATTGAAQFAAYDLSSTGGAGSNQDYITFDTRFRVLDSGSQDQLSLAFIRPPTSTQANLGETEHTYVFRFNINGINALTGIGFQQTAYPLGTVWHDARITIDVPHGTASLYLDGASAPIISTYSGVGNFTLSRNQSKLGDGSSTVSGGAEIASLRWNDTSMSVPLDGGQLEIFGRNVIREEADPKTHLNFEFAQRFMDGTIWMTHSVGVHGPDQGIGRLWSLDNGVTWAEAAINSIGTGNTYQFGDGKVISMSVWDGTYSNSHAVSIHRWDNGPQQNKTGTTSDTVTLPFTSQMFSHRSMIEAADGSLISSVYARMQDNDRFRAFALRSTDGGINWSYLSTIAFDPASAPGTGFSEPTLLRLQDDSLLSLVRSGSPTSGGPLYQAKSFDNGLTWTDPVQVADLGVDPTVVQLANGALVASSGRPGVYLLIDLSGTGDQWQKIPFYEGLGSSYTSLLEVEPNVVMLLHDESGFNGDLPASELPNHLVSTYLRVSLPVLGDLDGDGFVGITDLNIVLSNWNLNVPPGDPAADPSGDGFIGIEDLNVVLGNWNAGTPPMAMSGDGEVIPEPATLVLLVLGGITLVGVRHNVPDDMCAT